MHFNLAIIQDVMFWLLVLSLVVSAFLLARFISQLKQAHSSHSERLSLLIVSGSGRARDELQALQYLMQRKYSSLNNRALVRLGDYARISSYASCLCLLIYAALTLVTQTM